MWVNKHEWEEMRRRLDRLEIAVKYMPEKLEFTVYQPTDYAWYYGYQGVPKSTIDIKTVIERILQKLGMKLAYVAGQPEKVELEPVIVVPMSK